ncbi:MAG: cytochrome c3 family protein [Rhodoferax sp.]|nr:cytochrome c3 family protein [Rhodoferax sp.]
MKKWFVFFLAALLACGLSLAQGGVKKARPLPRNYGKVIIQNFSEQARMASVVFDHWQHRAKYTCRLCHVDLGFAMSANATGIRAADNSNGDYCGACHNGKNSYDSRRIFSACTKQVATADTTTCTRCHSQGTNAPPATQEFADFAAKFPKKRFGNGIDWIEGEAMGLVKLVDSLEGVASKSKLFKGPADTTITPQVMGMPDIVFSHDKHGVWNGCELCHPEVFPSVQKDKSAVYSMNEIFEGKYCGACHGKVAFPMIECQRCHAKPVAQQ